MNNSNYNIQDPFNFVDLKESFLTVITLTYNSSNYIEKCMVSLIKACHKIKETEKNIKISHLVVDGYSQDNTIEIIRSLSSKSQIFLEKPMGIYHGINYALSLVQSPYLMYLHSDDEIDENFFIEMFKKIDYLNKNKNYILYGTVEFIDNQSQLLFSRRPPFYFTFVQKQVPVICHPNAIYSTALEKMHPYKTNTGLKADQEHITEIAREANLIRIPGAKYRFRMSSNSSTMQKLKNVKYTLNFSLSLPRIYIRLFETKLIKRLLMKIRGKSYWSMK